MLRATLLLLFGFLLEAAQIPWRIEELRKTPHSWEAPSAESGVKAVWIAGPPYKGNPTRAFAYFAVPSAAGKAPGMVLIHGGGGTAFAEWVRLWTNRGFAAIAIDTVGTVPDKADPEQPWKPARKRHEHSGPAGWGDFNNVDAPITDQWSYHAVGLSVLAHSFLRAQPGVDRKRVGVTGISWGGYLTSIVASLDDRFRFGIPVYGCGYLGEDSAWLKQFDELGPERAAKWLKLWDPSSYLPTGRRPMFWINGTNDFAYVMSSWQKSYRLPRGERLLSLQVRMKHSHPDGAKPEEIHAYARAKLMGSPALVRIEKQGITADEIWARYGKAAEPVRAELCFTADTGRWQDRRWEVTPAEIDARSRRVSARIPAAGRACYLNLIDARDLIVSSEHYER